MMVHVEERDSADRVSHRKRVMTEARREQNRIASRAYRQRQTKGLQHKLQAHPRQQHRLRPRQICASSQYDSIKPKLGQQQNASGSDSGYIASPIELLQHLPVASGSVPTLASLQGEDLNLPNNDSIPLSIDTVTSISSLDPHLGNDATVFTPSFHTPPLRNGGYGTSGTDTSPITTSSLEVVPMDELDLSWFDPSSLEVIWDDFSLDVPKNPVGVCTSTATNPRAQSRSPVSERASSYDSFTNSLKRNYSSLECNYTSGKSGSIPFGVAQNSLFEEPRLTTLPDLYMNYIELSQVSTFNAVLRNALCLGINLQELMTAKFCSPFYRPTTAADDPAALIAAASVPSIPLHLQPTLPQILFHHHTFLDLLPFPVLRARAIGLAATSPQLFNTLELKNDVMEGGLICWRSRNTKFVGSNQPWDVRSWEAAPWFLKKWRMLLDGEDGEIWKQSMLWQNVRAYQNRLKT